MIGLLYPAFAEYRTPFKGHPNYHTISMSNNHTTRIEEVPISTRDIKFISYRETYPPFVPPKDGLQKLDDVFVSPGYTRRFERIWPPDDVKTDKLRWNDFQHYKVQSGSLSGAGSLYLGHDSVDESNYYSNFYSVIQASGYELYGDEYGRAGYLNLGLPVWYDDQAEDNFVVVPPDLENLQQLSLRSMLPLIKSELSILNSIYELKDFKTLPRTIRNIRQVATRSGRTLRKLLHASADGYLQTKFNLLPLLSDIAGLRRALIRTERRINDFVTRAGRVQHKHFRFVLTNGGSDPSITGPSGEIVPGTGCTLKYTSGAEMHYERTTIHDPSIFHAEIEYNYNYTRYQLEHARVLALLDAIGVNLNPVIIWNAIPWSFVIDWVLGVNTWLSHQRIGNMDPQINILRYLWSITRRRRILVQRKSTVAEYGVEPFVPYHTSGLVPLPLVTESAYRRVSGLPPASSFLTSGLNAEELSLGAALVITQRRHPNKSPLWKTQSHYP